MTAQHSFTSRTELPSGGKITFRFGVDDGKGKLEQPDQVIATSLGAASAASGELIALAALISSRGSQGSLKEGYKVSFEIASDSDAPIKFDFEIGIDLRGQYSKREINSMVLEGIMPAAEMAARSYSSRQFHGLDAANDMSIRIRQATSRVNSAPSYFDNQLSDESRTATRQRQLA